jgi:MYXO-CTERM domain-containing protein
MQITVADSGHCDPEDPGDSFCGFACGSGDPSTSTIFRRYTIAWMGCFLAADAAMAPYIGGAMYMADAKGGVLTGASTEGLDGLPCAGGMMSGDAGPGGADGGGPSADGGTALGDGGAPRDAGGSGGRDASTTRDSGATTTAEDDGGCGCVAVGADPASGAPWAFVLGIAGLWYLRRR